MSNRYADLIPALNQSDFDVAAIWDGKPDSLPDVAHVLVPNDFEQWQKGQRVQTLDFMWKQSAVTFWAVIKDITVIPMYRGHGWTDVDHFALQPGDIIHNDDMYYRNQCGYRFGDWQCGCPHRDKSDEAYCSSKTCPIASCADGFDQITRLGLADQYDDSDWIDDEDDLKYLEDSDWMELHARPRNAALSNLRVGFYAKNKLDWRRIARKFTRLRYSNPYIGLFALLDADFDQVIPYDHGCKTGWHPSESVSFNGGQIAVPYLNAIWKTENL